MLMIMLFLIITIVIVRRIKSARIINLIKIPIIIPIIFMILA